eukprot:jgi/Mesen1/268/ME1146751C09494
MAAAMSIHCSSLIGRALCLPAVKSTQSSEQTMSLSSNLPFRGMLPHPALRAGDLSWLSSSTNSMTGTGASSLRQSSSSPHQRKEHVGRSAGAMKVVAEKVVGIDLGTTNSAVAAMEGGQPTILPNAEGQRTTPSVVAYTKKGERLIGQIAKRQAVVNPQNTFYSVKRFIGRKMREVQDEATQVSYRVQADDSGNVKIQCPALGKNFSPEEISAQVCVHACVHACMSERERGRG